MRALIVNDTIAATQHRTKERKGKLGAAAAHSDPKKRGIGVEVGSRADAGEGGLRGRLTRPGPAGTWYVRFYDSHVGIGGAKDGKIGVKDGDEEAGEGKLLELPQGKSAGAEDDKAKGEEGPFPCTKDQRSLKYPRVPSVAFLPRVSGAESMSDRKTKKTPRASRAGGGAAGTTDGVAAAAEGRGVIKAAGAAGNEGAQKKEEDDRRRMTVGSVADTILRVAVARARLSVSVSPEMLVNWLYTVRGIEDSFSLYSQTLLQNAIDGDVLLSLTEKDLESAIEKARDARHPPPAVSPDREIEAYGIWKHSVNGEDEEILISIYKAHAGGSIGPYATLDTNWGVLAEESISVLTHGEAEEWRQRQKTRMRAHVRCILLLAKMTTSPNVEALLPLVWQIQPCDLQGRVVEAQLVKVLVHARFAYSQVATILGLQAATVEKLYGSQIGSADEGQALEYVALTQGVQRLVDTDLAEFERVNGRGNASIDHVAKLKAQVGEKLFKALLDTSSHPEGKIVAARLRLMMALRHKTENTAGWRPWWPASLDDKKEREGGKGSRKAGGMDISSAGVSDAAAGRERDSWRVNSEGVSYVQVFEQLLEQKDKAKAKQASPAGEQGAAGESVGLFSKKKPEAKKVLSEEDKAWGAAEAALRDCGIECRPSRDAVPGGGALLLQADAVVQGVDLILDPLPKLSRPWGAAQIGEWIKTLSLPQDSLSVYVRCQVNRQLDSNKLQEWREDVQRRDGKLEAALMMINKFHRLRFWTGFDLLAALLCWDVVTADVTPERLVSLLKSMRAGLLAKHGTLLNAFRTIDADHSKAISREELAQELAGLQVRIPPDYVEVVLTLADADGSGEIEFTEFKSLFNNLDTPETLQKLEGILKKLGGEKPDTKPKVQEDHQFDATKRIGDRDTWLSIQAEMSIISAEEGLISYRGRTYMFQDGGAGMVQVVDVQDNEVLYWNKHFTVSKQDLEQWRRKQFTDTRNALLASKGDEIEAVEAALHEGEIELKILVQRRSEERAAAKREAAQAAAAKARRAAAKRKTEGGREQEDLITNELTDNNGSGSEGLASKGAEAGAQAALAVGGIKEAKGVLIYERVEKKAEGGQVVVVGRRDGARKPGARQVRALEVQQKKRLLQRQTQMMPMDSLRARDFPRIVSKVATEADVAAAEIENDTFLRVAKLLHFVLDNVWIEVVTPSYSKASNLKVEKMQRQLLWRKQTRVH